VKDQGKTGIVTRNYLRSHFVNILNRSLAIC